MTKRRNERERDAIQRLAGMAGSSIFVCSLLAVVTLALFWPVKGFDFISLDDSDYVTANPQVLRGVSWKGLVWAFGIGRVHNWHPVTWLSHILDAQVFGAGAAGPHVVNLLFHVANTMLLFLILRSATGAHWRSGMVAGLFALHPLHVESVAWISERKDVLSTLFWLLTILAYLKYAKGGGTKAGGWRSPYYWLALGFFALGLMSKPMLVTLPAVLILLDYWPLGRIGGGPSSDKQGSRVRAPGLQGPKKGDVPASIGRVPSLGALETVENHNSWPRKFWRLLRMRWDSPQNMRKSPHPGPLPSDGRGRAIVRGGCYQAVGSVLVEKIPFFLLSAVSCPITVLAQKKAIQGFTYFPIGTRIENSFVSYVRYLGKMFWPVDLALPYPPHPGHWPAGLTVFAVALVFGGCAAAVRWGRRLPFLVTGWFWFLGTLVPVIGLVQVGIQSLADRYTYVPLIGTFIVVVWGAGEILSRWNAPKAAAGVAAAVVLGACAARTSDQLSNWQNSETVFRHALAVSRDDGLAHYSLGFYLFEKGRLEESIEHYRRALEINPVSVELLSDLGAALDQIGQRGEAREKLTDALRIAPDNALAHYRLGNVFAKTGNQEGAIEEYRLAVKLNPESVESRNNLAVALFKGGKVEEAIEQFRRITRYEPTNVSAHFNLGNALAAQPRWSEAAAEYMEALRLTPDSPEAHFGLARALEGLGRREEAVGHLKEALRLRPEYGRAKEMLETLGK